MHSRAHTTFRFDWEFQVEDAMADIESWENFNVFSIAKLVRGHILATIVFYSLERYSLIEKLGLPENKLLNFVAVRNSF